jgi:3-methylornithyl-N6-L-lysine dehydrogenase
VTRLTTEDLINGPGDLKIYDQQLRNTTTLGLLDLALKTTNQTREWFRYKSNYLTEVAIVPISTGQGILPDFANKVAEVGRYFGLPCRVTQNRDVVGWAEAISGGAEIILCADDDAFLAFNLMSRRVIDNTVATGQIYAAALDAAAAGVTGRSVGILGIGPVGQSAAVWLYAQGADLIVCDCDKKKLNSFCLAGDNIRKAKSVNDVLEQTDIILDATNASPIIFARDLKRPLIMAAPGMPLGIDNPTSDLVLLIHDPLQLGVTAMLVQVMD